MGLYMASRCVFEKMNEESYLYRGLLRGQAGLRSLAFEDYRAAAQQGASVAKSNMASMLSSGAVAEAGLEILRDHVGDYNSDDPGSPYEIRAALERSVAKERKAESELRTYGDRVTKAIHRLLEGWRRSRGGSARIEGQWQGRTEVGMLELTVTSEHVAVTLEKSVLAVQEVVPLDGFYAAFEASKVRLLFVIHDDVEMVAVNGLSEAGTVEWLELQPAT
jgi:hypothetical protein